MATPVRHSRPGTYFITSVTHNRRRIFQSTAAAELFHATLQHYRQAGHYTLHAYVIMPDHTHLSITPQGIPLERAVMLIKGGFSHRLGVKHPVWQKGFTDHRIRDRDDFLHHRDYIHHNPVRARLCPLPEDYPWSSAHHRQPTSAPEGAPEPALPGGAQAPPIPLINNHAV